MEQKKEFIVSYSSGSLFITFFPYKPFIFEKDELEIDAYYIASNQAYQYSQKLIEEYKAQGIEAYIPKINFKKTCAELGLGVIGMNDLLIHETYGTRFAISMVYVNGESLKLKVESLNEESSTIHYSLFTIHCTRCRACVLACPSKALDNGFNISKCLRQHMNTIRFDDETGKLFGNKIWGCDLCQRACPLNTVQAVRPPEHWQEKVKVSEFLKTLEENGDLSWLENDIGANMVSRKRLLHMTRNALKNMR